MTFTRIQKFKELREEIKKHREAAYKCICFQQKNPTARIKVLFLGDSTVVGVGAQPEESVPGRLAKDFREIHIENRAVSGAKIKDVLQQLQTSKHKSYTALFITIGGNDILSAVTLFHAKSEIEQVLDLAKKKSQNIFLAIGGKIETIPILPQPIKKIATRRQEKLTHLFKTAAKEKKITFIDFFHDKKLNSYFQKHPERYFATDRFHPNREGYKLAYEKILPCFKKIITKKEL